MIDLFGKRDNGRTHCDGYSRRDFLKIGGMAAGGLSPAGGGADCVEAASGLSVEGRVALNVLSAELRHLEAAAGVVAAASATDASGADGGQLQLALRVAKLEVELLNEHLQLAARRSETLQATLEQREVELQRTHTSLVDDMRQSGALLGSLAHLQQHSPAQLPLGLVAPSR